MEQQDRKLKIAILDNNEIGNLLRMNNEGIPTNLTLESYDYILIPRWVWKEVCDSTYRKAYVQHLIRSGYPIRIVRESQYNRILNEELTLLDIFEKSIGIYGELKAYLHRDILKGKPKDEIDYFYHEWIEMIYDNWPLSGDLIKNGFGEQRVKKKNAGEVSITFLAFILMYQKKRQVEITVYSHDADCRNCIDYAFEKTEDRQQYTFGSERTISYKNFESIIRELIVKEIIDRVKADELIDEIRDERRMIYLRKKADNTYEHRKEVVDNIRFKKMIKDEDILIVW